MTHNLCLQNLCTLKFPCWYWWLRGLRCSCMATYLLGLQVWIQSKAWMCVSCECCVLSGRGFCDEPITHPLDSYSVYVLLSVIVKPRQWRGPGLLRFSSHKNSILSLVDYPADLHLTLPLINRFLPLSLSVIECGDASRYVQKFK